MLMELSVFFGCHWNLPVKDEGVAWIKGSHLWNKIFLRVRFTDGHKVEGKESIINGKKYEEPARYFRKQR